MSPSSAPSPSRHRPALTTPSAYVEFGRVVHRLWMSGLRLEPGVPQEQHESERHQGGDAEERDTQGDKGVPDAAMMSSAVKTMPLSPLGSAGSDTSSSHKEKSSAAATWTLRRRVSSLTYAHKPTEKRV